MQWWVGDQMCPGCQSGFVKKSKVTKCQNCQKFAHKRKTCLSKNHEGILICTVCKPLNNTKVVKGERTFVCKICEVFFAKKFNLYRHIKQKHPS